MTNHLATLSKEDVQVFKRFDAQLNAIHEQQIKLISLRADLGLMRDSHWDKIIKKYGLPSKSELNENEVLAINYETRQARLESI